MNIKKYILFEILHYYPSGWLFDMVWSYDTIEEIRKVAENSWGDYKDVYIAERDTWKNIYKWSKDDENFIKI